MAALPIGARLLRVKFSSRALNGRLSDTLIDQRLIATRPQYTKIYMLIVIVFQNVELAWNIPLSVTCY